MLNVGSAFPRVLGFDLPAVAVLAAGIALGTLPTPGMAQNATPHRWYFELTPYVWGAGLDGTVRMNDRPEAGLGVKQSFGDILRVLDFAAMGVFEIRKDRWGGSFDAVYFKVADKGTVTGPLGFSSLSAKGAVTQQMYSLAASYRVAEGRSPVDLVGGLRVNSVGWDIEVLASVPVVGERARTFLETQKWVDPFVGGRLEQPISGRASLVGYADMGGFGVGSRFSWQGSAGVAYAIKQSLIGKVGYRYVSVDHSDSGFTYDISSAGLFVGLGIRW